MSVLSEKNYAGDWLKFEHPNTYCREAITVLAGSGSARALTSGMVLGKVALGAATPAAVGGNTGNGTIGAVTVALGAKAGVYNLVCIEPATNAGKFQVTDPDGIVVGVATVAVAFLAGGLGFTIADGSTDFVSGDAFTITVAAGSGKFVQIDFASAVGADKAAGILLLDVTAPDGADAKGTAVVRDAIVSSAGLTWPGGATTDQKNAAIAQLLAMGIVVREGA